MDMQQLVNKISIVKSTTQQVKMIYLVRTKRRGIENEYVAHEVPISSEIVPEIKEDLLTNIIYKLSNKVITDFNPTNSEIGTIEFLPTNQVNNFENIYQSLCSVHAEQLDELDFSNVWGYCLFVKYGDAPHEELLLYKKYTYPKLLKKGWILSLIGGIYTNLENKIVTIDSEVDAFSIDGNTFVLNKCQFEKFFNFSSSYQEIVRSSMDSLQQLNVIENFEEFTDQCLASDTLTRRLVKIISEQRFQTVQRCISNVPSIIEDFTLNVCFQNGKIVFDGNSSISDIITLIKGACVIGALDQEKYLANDTKNINIS